MSNKNLILMFGIVFLSMGFGAVGLGIYAGAKSYSMIKRSKLSRGVVVGLVNVDMSGTEPDRKAPVFGYQTEEGVDYKAVSTLSSRPAFWGTGDAVDVYYDPQNPQDA